MIQTPQESKKENIEGLKSIPIHRNLSALFEKFPDYSQQNTIVVSPFKNLANTAFQENDLVSEYFSPSSLGYRYDADLELVVLSKYLNVLVELAGEEKLEDMRTIIAAQSLKFAAERFQSHVHEFSNV